ncbi:MAG: 4-hydroxyphenylpyruvate dioxygenase [Bdellovibrionales bacterium]|nr:4-hydroxyphenylpyruvate dioxygenase [Bdellovibrionales bacterium]
MKIQNQGFDHVEFIVHDISTHTRTYERMGFEKLGERHLKDKGTRSVLYAQGRLRVLFTQADGSPAAEQQESVKFLRKHAEGICVLAVDVDDATQAFEETVARGAKPAMKPTRYESPEGAVVRSEIWTPASVRYAFIERKASSTKSGPVLFDEGLVVQRLESPAPFGIRHIDHLTNNVGIGEMPHWVEWYKRVFGFTVTRHFDIRTGRTGLTSDVVQSADGKIIVPINQATEPESQVQEFCDRMKGPGVQHLALLVDNLPETLKNLRKSGFKFLTVPHTYYEAIPTRVPGVTEDLAEMEALGILIDGEGEGYLLQIFSEEIVGPFFFEFIQRKGNKGFGEGNFRALFEAIERDQIKRGVLKA